MMNTCNMNIHICMQAVVTNEKVLAYDLNTYVQPGKEAKIRRRNQ